MGIQWLFPLPEPSGVNLTAPRLEARTVAAFAGDARFLDKGGGG